MFPSGDAKEGVEGGLVRSRWESRCVGRRRWKRLLDPVLDGGKVTAICCLFLRPLAATLFVSLRRTS